MKTMVCEQCGQPFRVSTSREGTAHFCSRACYGKWQSDNARGENASHWMGGPVELVCENCGKEYARPPSQANGSRFCSRKCHNAWKAAHKSGSNSPHWDRVEWRCPQCGKVLWLTPHWAKRRKFCSNRCSSLWTMVHSGRKVPRVRIQCEYCGKTFECLPYAASTARFCSHSCHAKSRAGERAANWQGGLSYEKYPTTFNPAFKRMIRERDGYRCAICKLPGKSVHHIDYDKKNTVPGNCITLCRQCHRHTNGHRDYWRVALADLLRRSRAIRGGRLKGYAIFTQGGGTTWNKFELGSAEIDALAAMQTRLWPV